MSSALNSVFGGGNILNLAMSVASVAFPPLGLATSLGNMLTQGVGQAVTQAAGQLVKEMGMPKFCQDIVNTVVKDVVGQLTQQSDHGCDQAAGQHFGGDIQNMIQDLTKMIMDNVKGTMDQAGGDDHKCQSGKGGKDGKGGSSGVSGGSWLEAIAKAMGNAAGEKAAKLVTLSQKLNDIASRKHEDLSDKAPEGGGASPKQEAQAQDAKEQSAVNAEFQAVSQEFSMLQTAFSTAIKGIGEGITKMASKQ
jgi:hypothetical protein